MTIQEQIEVMTAFANGSEVEIETYTGNWVDDHNPQWNWLEYNYRIKQEPKKMVKLYKFAYKVGDNWHETNNFHEYEHSFYKKVAEKVIRLDYTMIEVEED